jgi:hypothetical protein
MGNVGAANGGAVGGTSSVVGQPTRNIPAGGIQA